MAEDLGFWNPGPPVEASTLSLDEQEVVREALQYFVRVYRACDGGVAIDKVKLLQSAASKLGLPLENY